MTAPKGWEHEDPQRTEFIAPVAPATPEPDWYQQVHGRAAHANPPRAPWDPRPEGWRPSPITRWQMFWIVLAATLLGQAANDVFVYQYIRALLNQAAASLLGGFS